MNTKFIMLLALTLYAITAPAANLTTSTLDGGGQRATTANYANNGSVGTIGGISTVVSPSERMRHGYIGQLFEVSSIAVTGTPVSVNEGSTSQLSGRAALDDATTNVLSGADVNWNIVTGPIASINASGLATTDIVYTNTPATARGFYLGATNSVTLSVLDSNPDNYQAYAGDGLNDGWQVQYFGLPPNANAAPTVDFDGDGQDNLFEYVAGVVPTNAASMFNLQIANVTGQPNQKNLIFSPRFTDRTYTPEFRTNLLTGTYANLSNFTTNDAGLVRTNTDLSATQASKFYRIKITLPQL
jgi:hypothetical protein